MDDDTTSLCAAVFGLAGFEVLAAADAGAARLADVLQSSARRATTSAAPWSAASTGSSATAPSLLTSINSPCAISP